MAQAATSGGEAHLKPRALLLPPSTVHKQGLLQVKGDPSVLGFKTWSVRYVVLVYDDATLREYASEADFLRAPNAPLRAINLRTVVDVSVSAGEGSAGKRSFRLDLFLGEGNVKVSYNAQSVVEQNDWLGAVIEGSPRYAARIGVRTAAGEAEDAARAVKPASPPPSVGVAGASSASTGPDGKAAPSLPLPDEVDTARVTSIVAQHVSAAVGPFEARLEREMFLLRTAEAKQDEVARIVQGEIAAVRAQAVADKAQADAGLAAWKEEVLTTLRAALKAEMVEAVRDEVATRAAEVAQQQQQQALPPPPPPSVPAPPPPPAPPAVPSDSLLRLEAAESAVEALRGLSDRVTTLEAELRASREEATAAREMERRREEAADALAVHKGEDAVPAAPAAPLVDNGAVAALETRIAALEVVSASASEASAAQTKRMDALSAGMRDGSAGVMRSLTSLQERVKTVEEQALPGVVASVGEVRASVEAHTVSIDALQAKAAEGQTAQVDGAGALPTPAATPPSLMLGAVESVKSDIAALQEDANAVKAQLSALLTSSESAASTAAALQEQLASMDQQHSSGARALEARMESSEREVKLLGALPDRLGAAETALTRLEGLHERAAATAAAVEETKDRVTALAITAEAAQVQLSSLAHAVAGLEEGRAAPPSAENASAETQLVSVSATFESLRASVEGVLTLASAVEALRGEVSVAVTSHADATRALGDDVRGALARETSAVRAYVEGRVGSAEEGLRAECAASLQALAAQVKAEASAVSDASFRSVEDVRATLASEMESLRAALALSGAASVAVPAPAAPLAVTSASPLPPSSPFTASTLSTPDMEALLGDESIPPACAPLTRAVRAMGAELAANRSKDEALAKELAVYEGKFDRQAKHLGQFEAKLESKVSSMTALSLRIDAIRERVEAREGETEKRLEGVEGRAAAVDKRVEVVEGRVGEASALPPPPAAAPGRSDDVVEELPPSVASAVAALQDTLTAHINVVEGRVQALALWHAEIASKGAGRRGSSMLDPSALSSPARAPVLSSPRYGGGGGGGAPSFSSPSTRDKGEAGEESVAARLELVKDSVRAVHARIDVLEDGVLGDLRSQVHRLQVKVEGGAGGGEDEDAAPHLSSFTGVGEEDAPVPPPPSPSPLASGRRDSTSGGQGGRRASVAGSSNTMRVRGFALRGFASPR